jgi:hypothetical protein
MLRLDCNAAAAELDRLLQLERRAYCRVSRGGVGTSPSLLRTCRRSPKTW